MSGPDVIGVISAVFALPGVVKSCIDLLDLASSARSAESHIEDLLVHLQWQRIQFYCWVQQSGFANLIIRYEARPDCTMSDLLQLLPQELRFEFVLSHIARSIANMSQRLRTSQTMLERYATSCPSGSWTDKLRRAINPSQQALAQTVATTREPPKLDFLTRLRWVASDEKKLTQLVGELRSYNAELKDILPTLLRGPLERQIGIVLVASRSLTTRIAGVQEGFQELELYKDFRQHQGMARLLEQGREIEDFDRASHEADEDSTGSRSERRTFRGVCAEPGLYRDVSEFRLVARDSLQPTSREYTLDGNIPVVIEWRYYSSGTSREDLAYLDLRVHMLAMQLKQSSTLEGVNVLPCRGHFLDKANHRYGLVFQFPEGTHTSAPITLQVRLVEDLQAKPRVYRDYEDRLRAAHTLIITMYQMLCANWLHKNLTSENILIFEDSPHPFNLPVPHIGGFDFTRRDADLEMTESFASHYKTAYASIEKRLYWHPDRSARFEKELRGKDRSRPPQPTEKYRRQYDVYSLGVVLLEIGLWCPLKRIWKDCREDFDKFLSELTHTYTPQLRGRMGRVYADIVRCCLEYDFGGDLGTRVPGLEEDALERRRFLEQFNTLVVCRIEQLV
ncbi:hypothetical protein BDV33DRAFT_198532 [Aspergillus novoparasiticus]|uniref:Prion-inhibition and propagation HeLo domain-containing protein n=1 Tax=Aspergillus novoparasiticus TaxID=986946 RepID=A0A5N6F9Q7_9EURO|nr:hypothetical protein BDV33DRAFT_198532 [Aspergillus novoparasiticus]